MATGALVSEQEYLSTNYKPECEYIDGVLRQKSMPTSDHGTIQIGLGATIRQISREFIPGSEIRCHIRPGEYLVPDLVVQLRERYQHPYPTEPVHLCVEILSPDDSFGETVKKCEEYHRWGVEMTWIIDPESHRAWECARGQRPVEVPAGGSITAAGISILLDSMFEF